MWEKNIPGPTGGPAGGKPGVFRNHRETGMGAVEEVSRVGEKSEMQWGPDPAGLRGPSKDAEWEEMPRESFKQKTNKVWLKF